MGAHDTEFTGSARCGVFELVDTEEKTPLVDTENGINARIGVRVNKRVYFCSS